MITEKDILDAIEGMRKFSVSHPPRRIELTPEQFEALRKLPVKTIRMDAANRIFSIPFVVKDDLVPEHLFGTDCRPAFIDEDYSAETKEAF